MGSRFESFVVEELARVQANLLCEYRNDCALKLVEQLSRASSAILPERTSSVTFFEEREVPLPAGSSSIIAPCLHTKEEREEEELEDMPRSPPVQVVFPPPPEQEHLHILPLKLPAETPKGEEPLEKLQEKQCEEPHKSANRRGTLELEEKPRAERNARRCQSTPAPRPMTSISSSSSITSLNVRLAAVAAAARQGESPCGSPIRKIMETSRMQLAECSSPDPILPNTVDETQRSRDSFTSLNQARTWVQSPERQNSSCLVSSLGVSSLERQQSPCASPSREASLINMRSCMSDGSTRSGASSPSVRRVIAAMGTTRFLTKIVPHDAWLECGDQDYEVVQEKMEIYRDGAFTVKRASEKYISTGGKEVSEGRRSETLPRHIDRLRGRHLHRLRNGGCPCYLPAVSDPSNPKRIWWDSIMVVLICYDMVFIPLTIFDIPPNMALFIMARFSLLFWFIDIPATFCVGFHHKGGVEKDRWKIAKHYLKSFFFLDVLLVGIDGTVMLMDNISSTSGLVRIIKSYRMVRILRCLRLARLFKLPASAASIMQHIHSEKLTVLLGILKITSGVLMLNHVIACLWYGLCKWGDAKDTWLSRENLPDQSIEYLYMTSLHWSLTQFTPAAMEVFPCSIHERTFAVIVIVFALVTFSSFVSTITNAMNYLRTMNSEHQRNNFQLQRYFRTNMISLSLSARVARYVEFKEKENRRTIAEKDVKLLQLLSQPLQVDLHYEVYSQTFRTHHFFAAFDECLQRCMKIMCHEAVGELHISQGDVIFARGDRGKSFLIIKTGSLLYDHPKSGIHNLEQGDFVAEAGMWLTWAHHGRLQATTESILDALDYAKFLHCAAQNHTDGLCPSHYAHLFVEHMKDQDSDYLSDLPDINFNVGFAVHVAFIELKEDIQFGASSSLRLSSGPRSSLSSIHSVPDEFQVHRTASHASNSTASTSVQSTGQLMT